MKQLKKLKNNTMKYEVTNKHSISRTYSNSQGQEISFQPGETKKLKSKPPRGEGLWQVDALEETSKPEDIENTSQIEDGGDN